MVIVYPILKDRMYVINTKGFKTEEKIKIATYYLLPELLDTFKYHNNIKHTHTNNVIFFNCNTIHSIEEISLDCCYLRLGVLNTNGIK